MASSRTSWSPLASRLCPSLQSGTQTTGIIILCSALLLGLFHLIFRPFFPNHHGAIGHDYSLFLPKLLDGYYWYSHNGITAVPWFTPAFCGGVPLFPDPQSIYYSIPQFLTFVTDPLTSVYVTFMLFAALGLTGFYLLLRRVFATSAATAMLGAALFLFNGFYSHRIIVGHLTYHPFMLIPLIAYFLLRRPADGLKAAANVVIAGVFIAYMFQAGMVNVILPALVAVAGIGLIHGILFGRPWPFWRDFGLAGLLAVGLSIAKLVAALSYLRYFDRDIYLLPGATNFIDIVILIFLSLFAQAPQAFGQAILINRQWGLDIQEFEYGVTFFPLIVLSIAAASGLYGKWRQPSLSRINSAQWFQIGLLALLFIVPVVLNYYNPAWNAFLKSVPILKNSTSLVRWFSLYIPLIVVACALAIERTEILYRYRNYVAMSGVAIIAAINIWTDRGYYQAQPYDPTEVTKAYHRVQRGEWAPMITRVDESGADAPSNSALAEGSSELRCYEPLFGYRLERFPMKSLHVGPALEAANGMLNVKNPACYVYPSANRCPPGDHFSVAQTRDAEAFVQYRPFPFNTSSQQRTADVINIVVLVGVTLFPLLFLLRRLKRGAG